MTLFQKRNTLSEIFHLKTLKFKNFKFHKQPNHS